MVGGSCRRKDGRKVLDASVIQRALAHFTRRLQQYASPRLTRGARQWRIFVQLL